MAYSGLTGTIAGKIVAATLTPGTSALATTVAFPDFPGGSYKLGTAAGLANLLGYQEGTLTAGTVNIDLSALLDPYGTSKNWARVRTLMILNKATTSGSILLLDGTVANAYAGPFNGITTGKVPIHPSVADANGKITNPGLLLMNAPNTNGFGTTSGTSKVLKLDSQSFTIPYVVALLGADA